MNTQQEDALQENTTEHNPIPNPLRIGLKFRGFYKSSIEEIAEVQRGADSETFIAPPIQQDVRRGRYGKISLDVRFCTEGEPKFFPVFLPADPTGDTHKPSIDVMRDDRYTLTLHEGQEGVVVIAEKYGEKFQITLLSLWEPVWISSCFGDLDTVSRRFSSRHRTYVMDTITAVEYRAAAKQRAEEEQLEEQRLTEQRAEEEQRKAEQQRLEKERLAEERKRVAAEKDASAAQRLRRLFGRAKKEDTEK